MATTLTVRSVILFTQALLCIQAVFIAAIAWAALATLEPGVSRAPNTTAALLASALAAASVATAMLMKQGRKWAAVSAIAIEGLWTVAALVYAALPEGPPRSQYLLGFAFSLTALIGLLLKPVRSYFAITRSPETTGKPS
jgi:hypothetical protein